MLYCGRKKLTLKINSLCLILIAEVLKEILSGDDCVSVQQAQEGDEVTVHYEGRLASNNFKFDSSFDRGQPISFILGQNKVIQGWDQGLVGICPGNHIKHSIHVILEAQCYPFLLGQTVRLRIPSELGYGAKGAGEVIPPNSDLVFRVVLESLKTEKVKIDRLSGTNCVNDKKTREKDVVTFNYIGYLEDGNNFWI